ncbi:MAG: thiamine pyrophosphate-dependent enzyme, partial [Vicinamibacteria bacterium]
GYGIPGETLDGTDLEAVLQTMKGAIDRARKGLGPTLVESVTMRMRGHSEADKAEYVPAEMLADGKKKDPLTRFESELLRRGLLTEDRIAEVDREIRAEMDAALAEAESSPLPEGPSALGEVFAEEE